MKLNKIKTTYKQVVILFSVSKIGWEKNKTLEMFTMEHFNTIKNDFKMFDSCNK